MAKGRLILASVLATLLVMLPVATAWSVDPFPKDLSNPGGMRTDGAGDSGHPWDDGSSRVPPDSAVSRLTSVSHPPVFVPGISFGGTKWISGGVIFLLEKMHFFGISGKARNSYRK